MIVRRGKSWVIVTFVLVASVSGTAEFDKPSATIKLSSRFTRLASYQSTHRLLDDELTPHAAFPDRVGDAYRSAALLLRNNFVPNKSYFTHPKKYERFTTKNNPEPRVTRYKRYVAFSEMPNVNDSTTIDRPANANAASQNGTLVRIPLYKLRTLRHIETRGIPQTTKVIHHKDPISSFKIDGRARERQTLRKRRAHSALRVSSSGRTRRSLTAGDNYPPWRNVSDYYAERRAVMARFHARQREIEARYANRTNSTSRLDDAVPRNDPVTSNVSLFRLYPSKNSTPTDNRAAFRHPSKTIDPVYSNLAVKLDGRPVVQEADYRGGSRVWNNSYVEGQVVRYYTTPTPCPNATLSGTFAPKKRSKNADTISSGLDVQTTVASRTSSESSGNDHETWGKCKGKVVYQHNLLLGLKGPSTLDTVFEAIIQGPVCITCVEVVRYNETRAKVKFESGGRGHDYVKLRLQGYENEGFSYIIKVWGVKKIDPDCGNV